MSTTNHSGSPEPKYTYENHTLPDGRIVSTRIRKRPPKLEGAETLSQPCVSDKPLSVEQQITEQMPAEVRVPATAKKKAQDKKANSDVGYKKPPRHTQFKKGRSGNPKGRPRGSTNILTAMVKELEGTITVVENGRPVALSRPEALARLALSQALRGNLKFFSLLMGASAQADEKAEAARQRAAEAQKIDPRDQDLIDLFLAQMGMKPDKTDGGDDGAAA